MLRIKIVIGDCGCELNVVTRGAEPHCHHHGYTLSPQGDHIVATILATHSTHCSHKAATLLPACRHTVHTVSRQPDLIAQIIFAGHKAPCPVTPSPGHKISNNSQGIWNARPPMLVCTQSKIRFRCLTMCPNSRALERTQRTISMYATRNRE